MMASNVLYARCIDVPITQSYLQWHPELSQKAGRVTTRIY